MLNIKALPYGLIFLGAGLLSGVLSSYFSNLIDAGFYIVPGLVFGVAILICTLVMQGTFRLSAKYYLFVAASPVAFFVAVQTFFATADWAGGFVAGLVGALIISAWFYFGFKINVVYAVIMPIIGGILGIITVRLIIRDDTVDILNWGFAIWQAGVAGIIGLALGDLKTAMPLPRTNENSKI